MAAWIFAKSKVHVFLPGNRVEGGHFLCTARKDGERKRNGTCVCVCASQSVCERNCQFARTLPAARGSPFGAETVFLNAHSESFSTAMRSQELKIRYFNAPYIHALGNSKRSLVPLQGPSDRRINSLIHRLNRSCNCFNITMSAQKYVNMRRF